MAEPQTLAADPALASDIRDANRRAAGRGSRAMAIVGTNIVELAWLVAHLDQAETRADAIALVDGHFANLVAAARAEFDAQDKRH